MEKTIRPDEPGYWDWWLKEHNIEVDVYKEGTVLFIKEHFDAYKTETSITSVSICADKTFVESNGGTEGKKQRPFVVNCFNYIGSNSFTNEFVFDKKEVKPGDDVYVVLGNDCDPYGDEVLGVFTEELDKDFIFQKYAEHIKHITPEDELYQWNLVDEECYFIAKIFKVKVV